MAQYKSPVMAQIVIHGTVKKALNGTDSTSWHSINAL